MKPCLLVCAALGLFARAAQAQSGPTQHGFSVRAVPTYNRVLIEVGNLHMALPSENVRSFLEESPVQRPGVSFTDFMGTSSPPLRRLPAPYGGLGGVLIAGSLRFTRMDSLMVRVRVSDGGGYRDLDIPVNEALLFAKMLAIAVKQLESRPLAEATRRRTL